LFAKIEIIRTLLGTLVVLIASLGCALHLYRFSRGKTRPAPVVTLVIIGSTALVTGLQFVFPEVLTALRRNREALLAGASLRNQLTRKPNQAMQRLSYGRPNSSGLFCKD